MPARRRSRRRRIETGPDVATEVFGERRTEGDDRDRDDHRHRDRDASDFAGATRERFTARELLYLFGFGAVDEQERDQRGAGPHDEQRARVGARVGRVPQRAEPAQAEQHDHDPPGRE